MLGERKGRMRRLFTKIICDKNYGVVLAGSIGTHLISKLLAAYARRKSSSQDDMDARGHYKSNKRVVNTHIDCFFPHPNAKVASTLSTGNL